MSTKVQIAGNLISVEFSSDTTPVFLEKKNKDYILFGADNNYPSFILSIYKEHPEHGAIIKAKAKYLYGKGLRLAEGSNTIDLAKAQIFLSFANRFENWNSVFKKTAKSYEMFNGFCWQIIWSVGGTKAEVFFLKLSNCRVSKDGKKIIYCRSWTKDDGTANLYPDRDDSYKEFDVFNPNIRIGTQIYYYKEIEETPDEYGDAYPMPEYVQSVINITTDVAISQFQNSLVENGMSAQGILSLFNGEPDEAKKKQIEKMFNTKFTGPKRAGRIMFNFVNPGTDAKGAEYTSLTTSDLDKQFELILKTNQQKIITGHQVTNKSLFGISVEGALSDRTAIIESFEQMYNTYVEPRQQVLLNEIRMIAELTGVNLDKLEVQRLSPLGVDITDPNISKYFTEDEIREKLGYKPRVTGVDPAAVPVNQINENLQGLTGRDWIHIKRLVREVGNKKTTREAAAMMIRKAYGLSDDDINVLLTPTPTMMAKFNSIVTDYAIQMFEASAIDENLLDEFVSEEFVKFTAENDLLDILKGDPFISETKAAKMLGLTEDELQILLAGLIAAGLISASSKGFQPTEKGLNKKIEPVEVEIYTVYKYATRPDVPAAQTSRPFCKKMLALSDGGKVWTRESLDKLSNELGEDAWIYRGGFYTNPDTEETTPYCRHVWKSITRSRKKLNG